MTRSDGWRLASADPTARRQENRGRLWLVVAYLLCPCHLPVSMALLAAVFGTGTWASAIVGNPWRVGVTLGVLYALALWRGFRWLRAAKRGLAPGEALDCSDGACRVDLTKRQRLART